MATITENTMNRTNGTASGHRTTSPPTTSPYFRNQPVSFDSDTDFQPLEALSLGTLHRDHPDLKLYTPSSPNFPLLSQMFTLFENPSPPLAIARPTTIFQVQTIIRFCTSSMPPIPVSVRSGGHDPARRSMMPSTLCIDMREIDSLALSPDKTTLRIGGGTLMVNIQLFLREHKLAATAGLYGTVGAANWSMGGGYGPYNGRFGMGVEQIVAARVVNAQGEVADADEEMLWGIRGAGGNFGVAVELELKVHKLEKMLWGQVFFALAEAKRVFEGYRDLIATEWPEEWYGGFVFLNIPGVGKVLMLYGSWCSDDLKRGWAYVEKVRALGTPVIDTVKEVTPPEALEDWDLPLEPNYSLTRTAPISYLSDEFIDLMIEYTEQMPAQTACNCVFVVHACHGKGARTDEAASFGIRKPHMLLEAHSLATDLETKHLGFAWVESAMDQLQKRGLKMDGGYPNLMMPEESIEKCFGKNLGKLKALKKKLDPNNVFANAIPSLV